MSVELLLVPYDSGQREARLGRGPDRLVEAGLADALRGAGHDVATDTISLNAAFATENAAAFTLARLLAARVHDARLQQRTPLVLSGNCSAAIGVVAGLGVEPTGVVWFDAHGDLNTPETSRSAFFDGMSLAVLTGRCWSAAARDVPGFAPVADEHVVHVGARDLDPAEIELLERSAIARVPASPGDDHAFTTSLATALDRLAAHVRQVYVHVDLDVLDPAEGHANEYAAPQGLRVSQLVAAIERIARRFTIAAASLTAYDPTFDRDGRIAAAAVAVAHALLAVPA